MIAGSSRTVSLSPSKTIWPLTRIIARSQMLVTAEWFLSTITVAMPVLRIS